MIRSMTGYASEFLSSAEVDISLELKSVNSRYFEFKFKSSADVDAWENDIKNAVFERLRRGKIDLYLRIVEKDAKNYNIVVNTELAQKYEAALKSLSGTLSVTPELAMRDFMALGNILQIERTGTLENLKETVMGLLTKLLDKAMEMMNIEGEKTRDDINHSLGLIEKSLASIETVYPAALEKYKAAMKDRLKELFGEGMNDPFANNRILMETELVASRTAINEEIVRLKSHIGQFQKILAGKANGDSKKLDFIGQEMNRETNTIASKSSEYEIVENTIVIKGEIEKIREQLRNLE